MARKKLLDRLLLIGTGLIILLAFVVGIFLSAILNALLPEGFLSIVGAIIGFVLPFVACVVLLRFIFSRRKGNQ